MDVGQLLPQAVEHRPHRVADAPAEQAPESRRRHVLPEGAHGQHHHPAHGQVADHGHHLEALHADGVEHHPQHRRGPHHGEHGPAGDAPQAHQGDGGVGPGDQKEDGAVVQRAEHHLGPVQPQPVVQGGDRVQQHHGAAVHRRRSQAQGRFLAGEQQEHQCSHREQRRYPVADGREDLLPQGVAGQAQALPLFHLEIFFTLPVRQRAHGTFHFEIPFLYETGTGLIWFSKLGIKAL